jgi:predicted branched-subunit amino acid permease
LTSIGPEHEGGWFDISAMRAGARAILPLSIGVFPFGLAYGVAVVSSPMNDLAGALASVLVIAGAAQLAVVDLTSQGAPWFIIVGTALVINARFMMYSGALAPSFSEYPRRWRIPLAFLVTDQATVTSLLHNERVRDPLTRMAFYLGAAASFALAWVLGTFLGVVVGAAVPPELQIGFAVPLMFVALLVPSVRDRAGLIAAAVGFSVTLIARDAPLNSGLLIGATAGIAFGMLAKLRPNGTPATPLPADTKAATEAVSPGTGSPEDER